MNSPHNTRNVACPTRNPWVNDQRDVVISIAGLGSGEAVLSAEEMEDMLRGKEKQLLAREGKKRGRYWSSSRRGFKLFSRSLLSAIGYQ
jgi:hypothetical protein